MRCDDCREAISARLDGEAPPPGLDETTIEAHLADCPACHRWRTLAEAVHRDGRVRPAAAVPDLTDVVLARVPITARPRPVREGVRYALLAVGLTQLVLAVPTLLLAGDTTAPVHVAREMGAFELALGVGLLSAAWRPRLATGLLPFAAALAVAMAATAVLDLAGGEAVVVGEAHHVLDLVGVTLLWLLPRRPGRALRGEVDPVPA